MMNMVLRDYQAEMLDRLLCAWQKSQSVMVQMPTGTGKTVLMAEVIRRSLVPASEGQTRWEIADQVRDEGGESFSGERLGVSGITVTCHLSTVNCQSPILLLETDSNPQSGWASYDFLIAANTLFSWDGEHNIWTRVAPVPVFVNGNELELSVPRKLLGQTGKKVQIDFKWADNPSALDSIIDLCTSGDTAPNRRFAYRFLFTR